MHCLRARGALQTRAQTANLAADKRQLREFPPTRLISRRSRRLDEGLYLARSQSGELDFRSVPTLSSDGSSACTTVLANGRSVRLHGIQHGSKVEGLGQVRLKPRFLTAPSIGALIVTRQRDEPTIRKRCFGAQ